MGEATGAGEGTGADVDSASSMKLVVVRQVVIVSVVAPTVTVPNESSMDVVSSQYGRFVSTT